MLRWLTSGESHGPALVGILEGLPAGVHVTTGDVQEALARRRLGYGRGARMAFEQDEVRILAGLRHGVSQGGPMAIEIGNTEWPKWVDVMAADPVDDPAKLERARNAPLTRPRPGHADLVGMRKYNFDDARPVLERASARETATRVALGQVAARFLEQSVGLRIVSHVVGIGPVSVPDGAPLPAPGDVAGLDADPVRCFDAATSAAMVAEIDDCQKAGDTLGGVVEVLAYGVPTGLGSYTHWDKRLDARLVLVGDGGGARGARGFGLIVEDDGRPRQVIEEGREAVVKEAQPVLHARMAPPGADGLIERIVRARGAEGRAIGLPKPGDGGVIEDHLGHRHEVDPLEPVGRALRDRVEAADRVDLVAEEVEPHRPRAAGRKDVDDAAAKGAIARLGHRRGRGEAHACKPAAHGLGRDPLAPAQRQARALDRFGGGHALRRGRDGGEQHESALRRARQCRERRHPARQHIRVGRDAVIGQAIPRRKLDHR